MQASLKLSNRKKSGHNASFDILYKDASKLPAFFRNWLCSPVPTGGICGPIVEGDTMLSNSPGGEVGGHDQEPGEDNQLEQEGEEREEQTGDGLTNGF